MTVASMTKLESHLEDPRYLEKFEDMFVTTRFYMINQVNEGLRPWEHDGKNIPFDMRQKDIDTVLFFYFLHKDYLGKTNSRVIPQTQIYRLLALFLHTKDPLKRINTHFSKFNKEDDVSTSKYITESFIDEFYPILLK